MSLAPAEVAAMVAAYQAGAGVETVAAQFGRSFNATRKHLSEAGVMRPRGRQRSENVKPKRRFERHSDSGRMLMLDRGHPAVEGGRTLFPGRAVDASLPERILKSGEHSRKIGSLVVKGAWRGFPIYTLTLEERKTCPASCHHWRSCMGNSMPWPERLQPGRALESRLGYELWRLQMKHPAGFVVRLHVLGDFYSTGYVRRWLGWLRRFPALHVFGYTAWPLDSEVGALVAETARRQWERFAVRLSTDARTEAPGTPRAMTVIATPDARTVAGAIVCPAQTGRSDCCGTCGLCWGTRRDIAFLLH